jgi:hypothetical protein
LAPIAALPTPRLAIFDPMSEKFDLDGEVLAEEDVAPDAAQQVRALEHYSERPGIPALRAEVRTAAIAAAGGALAGAVTVAAVRAVSAVGSRGRSSRRLSRRKADRPANILASRSFLVDVHVLGR